MAARPHPLTALQPRRILVRAVNWIGDAVMTLPALATIRANFPTAHLTVLAQPWVADLYRAHPGVDRLLLYDKKNRHRGVAGLWRLGRQLAEERFDLAILLQNAFEAAVLARLARIPVIAGYSRDGRRPLLTHPVTIRREIRQRHQVHYYQDLLVQLGLAPQPDELTLPLDQEARQWAEATLAGHPRPLIGLNPGAAYGPAKRWPASRFAQAAAELYRRTGGTPVVFGTAADREAARTIGAQVPAAVDLTGRTTLAQAMAAIATMDLFLTNDSGLMHVAAAAGVPLVAVFGSTDPVATGPFSKTSRVVRHPMDCSPCLRPRCRKGVPCMTAITTDEVVAAGLAALDTGAAAA